MYDILILILKT